MKEFDDLLDYFRASASGQLTMRMSGFKPENAINKIRKALSALPDRPMSEDEILKIAIEGLRESYANDFEGLAKDVIRALKSANVLYVEE